MFALALIVALAALALASAAVLADSGLRWWSAFGALRAEIARGQSVQVVSAKMRPARMSSRTGAAIRTNTVRKARTVSATRAVA